MSKVRLGIMGFGEIGRHIYRLCMEDDMFEVVAISDYGKPDILAYLLQAEVKGKVKVAVEDGNFINSPAGRARVITGGAPGDVPWDIFNVDVVIDATGIFKSKKDLTKHLNSGAPHVLLSTLPEDEIDRIVVMGVNDDTIDLKDRIVSAGSATTNATALMLKFFDEKFGVDYAMLTTVHSYTSDQPLRDKAGADFRRSRSAAENIIPNETPTPKWIPTILPNFKGRIEGSALNVPIPNGSLLDLTMIFKNKDVSIDQVNEVMYAAAAKLPNLVQVAADPIVSSDVINNRHAVVFDKLATLKSQGKMIKTLVWYHTALAQACRILDVIRAYHILQEKIEKGGSK
jgi:glyceraldehyde 3-phosphate dehydrogenase